MEKFGRLTWKILHYISDIDLNYYIKKNIIYDICKIYPCLDCRIDFLENFSDIIHIDICLKTWLFNYHNHINDITNKPLFTYENFNNDNNNWYRSLNKHEIYIFLKFMVNNLENTLINNVILLNIIKEFNNLFNTSIVYSLDRNDIIKYINYKINKLENLKIIYFLNNNNLHNNKPYFYYIKKIKILEKKTILETNENYVIEFNNDDDDHKNILKISNYLEYTLDHI